MGSGGEAEDADAAGVDVPLGGVGADDSDGSLGVFQGRGGLGHVGAGVGDAIFDQDAGDAFGVEPVADFGAFQVDGQDVVAAAGEDYYGCSSVFAFGRVEREGGRGDVAQVSERVARDQIVF